MRDPSEEFSVHLGSHPSGAPCDAPLTFTTGGDAAWFAETEVYHGGDHDAARSGAIGAGQNTWLEVKVAGKGTLTYWHKLSTTVGSGEEDFYIDGAFQWGRSGDYDWAAGSCTLPTAGLHTLRWKYARAGGSVPGGQDCLWVDEVQGTGWPEAYDALAVDCRAPLALTCSEPR